MSRVRFLLDGKPVDVEVEDPTRTLLQYLREDRRRVGTKEGCASGDCGACTAVVAEVQDGRLHYRNINTCITFVGSLHGRQLITVDHLADTRAVGAERARRGAAGAGAHALSAGRARIAGLGERPAAHGLVGGAVAVVVHVVAELFDRLGCVACRQPFRGADPLPLAGAQGVGVRAVNGDKTGLSYSDQISAKNERWKYY